MNEWQALLLAIAFGVGFNAWVDRHNRPEHTVFHVIIGVAVTLSISALVEHQTVRLALHDPFSNQLIFLTNAQHAALFELRFFAASGLPMIIGALARHYKRF